MWGSCSFSIAVEEELLSVRNTLRVTFSTSMTVCTHCWAPHNMPCLLILQRPWDLSIALWLPFYKWGNWGFERWIVCKSCLRCPFYHARLLPIFPFERDSERKSKINNGTFHPCSSLEISFYFLPHCVLYVYYSVL